MKESKKTRETTVKKKRRISRFHLAVILFAAILVVSAGLTVLLIVQALQGDAPDAAETPEKPSAFGVQEILVEGDTRYDEQEIIQASGIRVGQSVFSLNLKLAAQNVLAAFPYLETVDIQKVSFGTVRIALKEVEVIGARYADGAWIVVGSNGKALEALPVEGDRPPRYLYFKGVTPQTAVVGEAAMDEESLRIIRTLLTAFADFRQEADEAEELPAVDLTREIVEIDITNKADIRLNWKNRMVIKLGNESNLYKEINVLATSLALLQKSQGHGIAGQIDLRSYSDSDADNNKLFYTPQDVLDSESAEPDSSEPVDPEGGDPADPEDSGGADSAPAA